MKTDKDTLIKNIFWILLGAYVTLALFVILWLETSVEGAVESERQKIKAHRDKLEKNEKAKLNGLTELNLCKEKIKTLRTRKDEVWQEQWGRQQGLMFWPDKVADTYADLRFGEAVEPKIRVTYAQAYINQYEDMAQMFQTAIPIRDQKTRKPMVQIIDPVQFAGGWKVVLMPVEKWKLQEGPPTDEEVWLAQEDTWVRRELLEAVRKANLSVARFKVKPAAEGAPAGKAGEFQQIFENPYWRIELNLYPKNQQFYIKGKITNVSKKRLALGKAYFWLQVQADEKEPRVVLPIEGEARGPGESGDIKETPLDLLQDPAGLLGLEQILEPRTAPVRRIDMIALYYHSHRTYEPALLTAKQFQGGKAAAPKQAPKASPPPAAGTKPAAVTGDTPNGLFTHRYTDVTDQVRRMPLTLVVIASQAHIPEVETALANSKLRMQITQVNWQHYHGTLKTGEEQATKSKDAPKPLGVPRNFTPSRAIVDDSEKTLVELSIYGIASLYERPKKKDEGAAKKPAPVAKKGKK